MKKLRGTKLGVAALAIFIVSSIIIGAYLLCAVVPRQEREEKEFIRSIYENKYGEPNLMDIDNLHETQPTESINGQVNNPIEMPAHIEGSNTIN